MSTRSLVFACSPDSPLLRREGRSLRPPSARENLLSASDYWREGRFRAQTRLGSHGVLTSRQERFAMQLRERLPDSGSGLIIGDFTLSLLPQSQVSNTRTLQKLYEFLVEMLFLSEWGFRACFFETGTVSACLALFDPRGFP